MFTEHFDTFSEHLDSIYTRNQQTLFQKAFHAEKQNEILTNIVRISQQNQNNQAFLKRIRRHKFSLQVESCQKHISQEIQNSREDIFVFDDNSQNMSFEYLDNINISEISSQQLFSPKNTMSFEELNQDIQYHPLQQKVSTNSIQTKDVSSKSLQNQVVKTFQCPRKLKVQRYLNKKNKRIFSKKVSYSCRKIVAQSRLRIKGRFITKSMAQDILGLDTSRLSNNQIKLLLQKHFQK